LPLSSEAGYADNSARPKSLRKSERKMNKKLDNNNAWNDNSGV
jgi:hypothetical protein